MADISLEANQTTHVEQPTLTGCRIHNNGPGAARYWFRGGALHAGTVIAASESLTIDLRDTSSGFTLGADAATTLVTTWLVDGNHEPDSEGMS